MKEMNLGRILIENRHKRGITQEERAALYFRVRIVYKELSEK